MTGLPFKPLNCIKHIASKALNVVTVLLLYRLIESGSLVVINPKSVVLQKVLLSGCYNEREYRERGIQLSLFSGYT